jgi:hypothetical protein
VRGQKWEELQTRLSPLGSPRDRRDVQKADATASDSKRDSLSGVDRLAVHRPVEQFRIRNQSPGLRECGVSKQINVVLE